MEIQVDGKQLKSIIICFVVITTLFPGIKADAQENQDAITVAAWNNAGTTVALGFMDGRIEVTSADGQMQQVIQQETGRRITALAWHPDDTLLASGSNHGNVQIWDTVTGTYTEYSVGWPLDLGGLLWSSSGSQLLAISLQRKPNVFVWNTNSGELVSSASIGTLYDPQWNEDNTLLIAGNASTVLALVSTGANVIGQPIGEPSFPTVIGEQVFTAAWSPNEDRVAGGTPSGRVRVWNIDTAELIMEVGGEGYDVSTWQLSRIVELMFTPNGQEVQALDGSGMFRIWDVATSDLITEEQLPVVTLPLYAAAFSPDGTQIAYGGEGGGIRIENVPSLACTFTIAAGDAPALVSAIDTANADPDPDTICLADDSTYTLTAAHNTQSGANGLPLITSDITLVGNGATITRDATAPPFRLLLVDTAGTLTLEDVTVSNGLAALAEPGDDGGAIYNLGSLTLVDSTVTASTANADGGGILSDGTLTIEGDSHIEGNTAADDGGGIYAAGGTLTVTDATLATNTAGDQGGGIRSVTSTVTLTNASLIGNSASAASGGGLYGTSTTLAIHAGTISGNTANTGGGIYLTNSPSAAQLDSAVQIVNNMATTGGGLFIGEYGAAALTDATVSGNQASSSAAGVSLNEWYRLWGQAISGMHALHRASGIKNRDRKTVPVCVFVLSAAYDSPLKRAMMSASTSAASRP